MYWDNVQVKNLYESWNPLLTVDRAVDKDIDEQDTLRCAVYHHILVFFTNIIAGFRDDWLSCPYAGIRFKTIKSRKLLWPSPMSLHENGLMRRTHTYPLDIFNPLQTCNYYDNIHAVICFYSNLRNITSTQELIFMKPFLGYIQSGVCSRFKSSTTLYCADLNLLQTPLYIYTAVFVVSLNHQQHYIVLMTLS